MIGYSESGWVWDGGSNTGNNVSIISNKTKAAIFPKKNGFNDGNIQLLIEKGINEKSRVNVRLIDKYDFSIEVLNGKKIDLINHSPFRQFVPSKIEGKLKNSVTRVQKDILLQKPRPET